MRLEYAQKTSFLAKQRTTHPATKEWIYSNANKGQRSNETDCPLQPVFEAVYHLCQDLIAYPVADLGEGPGLPLVLGKNEEMTEGRKASRASTDQNQALLSLVWIHHCYPDIIQCKVVKELFLNKASELGVTVSESHKKNLVRKLSTKFPEITSITRC